MLVVEFTEHEEQIFNEMVTWLSEKMAVVPTTITKIQNGLLLNQFSRTAIDE